MFDTDSISDILICLLPGQVDLLLRSLELYAFNLHNTWGVKTDDDLQELRNSLVFHTYESLLAQRNKEYRIGYNLLNEIKIQNYSKKKTLYYKKQNKIA